MNEVRYQPIGIIHSPFEDVSGMPIQPSGASGVDGWIQIHSPYVDGLKDLEGFSHIILLYHFHRVGGAELLVVPFLDTEHRGVFATRAPTRPNPIGLSIVRLKRMEGDRLEISNVDVLDGTPLLDVKPYVPGFDQVEDVRTGWLPSSRGEIRTKRSDDRFGSPSDAS